MVRFQTNHFLFLITIFNQGRKQYRFGSHHKLKKKKIVNFSKMLKRLNFRELSLSKASFELHLILKEPMAEFKVIQIAA